MSSYVKRIMRVYEKTQKHKDQKCLLHNKSTSINYANKLRKYPTYAEFVLIQVLKFYGIKYKFQVPVYSKTVRYIIDFEIISASGKKYAIEVDGSSHDKRKEYDYKRSFFLYHNKGYCVIRFMNEDVIQRTDYVINKIKGLIHGI